MPLTAIIAFMKRDNLVHPLNVAYIIVAYPSLTKTFVDREVATLREMGINIEIYSLWRSKGPLSPEQQQIEKEINTLFPLKFKTALKGHLRFILRKPVNYFSTLIYLLTRPHPTFRSHWRTLKHFHQGIYAASLLADKPIDHIHAHFLNQSATIALIASRLLNVNYSVTVHASSELFSRPMMIQEKLHRAKFVATCTDYNRKYLEVMSNNGLAGKLKVIYHGLDAQLYQRKQPPPSGKPVIIAVGQLRERKGFSYLIDACEILKRWGIEYECRIIGDGPLRPELERKIHQQNVEDTVTLCGALSQAAVREQYEEATIFTMPAVLGKDGDRDGIPNVILEAMAMELPVIATRHSGIPEVVKDQENGILVPPENSNALAAAIQKLIKDPALRIKFGKQGRKTILEQFDPWKNAQKLVEGFAE